MNQDSLLEASDQHPAPATTRRTEHRARRFGNLSRAGRQAVSKSGRWARLIAKSGLGLLRQRVPLDHKALLFILGCQRSGTTLMTRIFERDWDAWVFHEVSRLSSDDAEHRVRLNELGKVEAALAAQGHALLVAKPLVESQHARRLLDYFPNARALWLYRHYHDVAASDLERFGLQNGIKNLRPIVELDQTDWRAEDVDAQTGATIQRHFHADMNPYDAAALFWFSRNMHYLRCRLEDETLSHRVMLLPYEQLVQDPEGIMRRVYRFVERPFPGPRVVAEVHDRSLGKGNAVAISSEIEMICGHLLDRLDELAGHCRR